MADVRELQLRADRSRPFPAAGPPMTCVSIGDELYEMPIEAARRRDLEIVIEATRRAAAGCRTIVDLGAGYGFLLDQLRRRLPGRRWIGADASRNAVEIAGRVFRGQADVRYHQFNFYDPESYGFLGTARPPILILTRHAIEQLPSARPFFDALGAYRDRLGAAVHFEPVYRPDADTALGLMRCRYIENQDYNRDLLAEIQRREEIRLLDQRSDVIGLNPLLPTSVIQWEFR